MHSYVKLIFTVGNLQMLVKQKGWLSKMHSRMISALGEKLCTHALDINITVLSIELEVSKP